MCRRLKVLHLPCTPCGSETMSELGAAETEFEPTNVAGVWVVGSEAGEGQAAFLL